MPGWQTLTDRQRSSLFDLGVIPPDYGPSTTIYNRFNRWSHRGLRGRIFATLAAQAELPDDLSIDSTAVRAHRSAHGGTGGRKFRPSGARVAVQPPKSML